MLILQTSNTIEVPVDFMTLAPGQSITVGFFQNGRAEGEEISSTPQAAIATEFPPLKDLWAEEHS